MSRRDATRNSLVQFERPPGFVFRKSGSGIPVLHCENVSLSMLARRYGTPLYLYSAKLIRERLATFTRAFSNFPHTVCYSVKANSNLHILRLLAREGCGFDVVSGGELERVLVANRRSSKKIVFSGVGKSRGEISAGLRAGILLFNVESESELAVLADCACRLRTVAPVALRVNPDVAAETHPHISTGLQKHKFGVPIDDAARLYAHAAQERYLKVAGVSVHIGSQITNVAPFAEAMARVADLIRELRNAGLPVEFVDAGGGLGISYELPQTDFAGYVREYADAVTRPLRGLDVHLLLEPGRVIIGPAGVLLTKVLYKKQNGGKRFLIVDAAMNDFIRAALYDAYHEIVPVESAGDNDLREQVDLVGPICESSDCFAHDRILPRVEEGDLLAILDVGAYGMVLSSNYNTRPRPAEILVNGKSAKVIRRREKVTDLLRAER